MPASAAARTIGTVTPGAGRRPGAGGQQHPGDVEIGELVDA